MSDTTTVNEATANTTYTCPECDNKVQPAMTTCPRCYANFNRPNKNRNRAAEQLMSTTEQLMTRTNIVSTKTLHRICGDKNTTAGYILVTAPRDGSDEGTKRQYTSDNLAGAVEDYNCNR